jgi:hypothetical protein
VIRAADESVVAVTARLTLQAAVVGRYDHTGGQPKRALSLSFEVANDHLQHHCEAER